jgi:hypothetical protein
MQLSAIPIYDLKVGDKVISHIGTPGEIIEIIPREQASRQEDNEIVICWSNGKVSTTWHFQCEYITLAE